MSRFWNPWERALTCGFSAISIGIFLKSPVGCLISKTTSRLIFSLHRNLVAFWKKKLLTVNETEPAWFLSDWVTFLSDSLLGGYFLLNILKIEVTHAWWIVVISVSVICVYILCSWSFCLDRIHSPTYLSITYIFIYIPSCREPVQGCTISSQLLQLLKNTGLVCFLRRVSRGHYHSMFPRGMSKFMVINMISTKTRLVTLNVISS